MTSRRGAATSRPRGVAAVPVVLLLFFGLGVMLLYANRALIFEQRTAANQARDRVAVVGARPAVVPVRQGRDTLYRAMVTGLSRDAAMRACPRSGGPAGCAVVSPQG